MLSTELKELQKGTVEKPHLLIDGDLLVFSVCAAVEYKYRDPDNPDEEEDMLEFLPEILKGINAKIKNIVTATNAGYYTVFFSGKENFRFTVMPEYKANRATVWRPANLKTAIKHSGTKHPSMCIEGVEADDLLAVFQDPNGTTVIATLDKDMLQLRGRHFRWETQHQGEKHWNVTGHGKLWMQVKCKECGTTHELGRDEYEEYSKVCKYCDADLRYSDNKSGKKNATKEIKGNGAMWFLYQCLIGDPTDGIMGCGTLTEQVYRSGKKAGQKYQKRKGIGSIKAFEILAPYLTYGSGLAEVKNQYIKLFGGAWVTELLKQGRCLYMTKHIEGTQIRLWHFNSSIVEVYDTADKSIITLKDEEDEF